MARLRPTLTILAAALLAVCAAPPGSAIRPVEGRPTALRVAHLVREPQEESPPREVEIDTASAAEHAPVTAPTESPWSRFGFSVGGLLTTVNSTVRIDLGGVGIGLDLEDALDLDASTTRIRTEAFWHYTENRRHRIDLSWLDLNRSANKVPNRSLDIGNGITLPIGAIVDDDVGSVEFGYVGLGLFLATVW